MRNVGFTGSFVDDRLKNFCLVIERYSLTKVEVIFFKSCCQTLLAHVSKEEKIAVYETNRR